MAGGRDGVLCRLPDGGVPALQRCRGTAAERDYPSVERWYRQFEEIEAWRDPFKGLEAPALPPVPG